RPFESEIGPGAGAQAVQPAPLVAGLLGETGIGGVVGVEPRELDETHHQIHGATPQPALGRGGKGRQPAVVAKAPRRQAHHIEPLGHLAAPIVAQHRHPVPPGEGLPGHGEHVALLAAVGEKPVDQEGKLHGAQPGARVAGRGSLSRASSTCPGAISTRHLWCPLGHSRWKQGPQSTGMDSVSTSFAKGGVNPGEVEPYSTTRGRDKAAAICMRPESLLTTAPARDSRSMASANSVSPARIWQCWAASPAPATRASATARSLAEPNTHTCQPRATMAAATAP